MRIGRSFPAALRPWLSAGLAAPALVVAAARPAVAEPSCTIRVLRPVTDDTGNRWRPGQIVPVDIARGATDGGAFCAHHGSCIPRRVGGLPAVRLLDCRIGEPVDDTDHRLVRR